jgi:hypothetical protein
MSVFALAQDELKRQAAWQAVEYVESGMVVGLGTGSTAAFAVERLGQLLKEDALRDIVAVPTSIRTYEQAKGEWGLRATRSCCTGRHAYDAGTWCLAFVTFHATYDHWTAAAPCQKLGHMRSGTAAKCGEYGGRSALQGGAPSRQRGLSRASGRRAGNPSGDAG